MSVALDSLDYCDDPWAEEDLLSSIFEENQLNVEDPVLHHVQCFEGENHCFGVMVDEIVVIQAKYEIIRLIPLYAFHHPYFLAVVGNTIDGEKKYGILSDLNEMVFPLIYDNILWWKSKKDYHYVGDYCYAIKLKQQDKCFCYDVKGKSLVFEIDDYTYIGPFHSFDYYSKVVQDYIDKIGWTDKKYSIIRKGERYGIILNDGTVVIRPKFKKINEFDFFFDKGTCEMRAKVVFDDSVEGWIDYRSLIFGYIPSCYKSAKRLYEDRYIVLDEEGKYGIIDKSNNVICGFIYDDYVKHEPYRSGCYFSKDYVIFHSDNGWSVVDAKTGVSTAYYDQISWHFSCKYCYVSKNNKEGVISVSGEEVIPCIYDKISGFNAENGITASNVIFEGEKGWIVDAKFISKKDKDTNNDTASFRKSNWREHQTYGKYSGSYAQDEMGYSDDDIDTIFDGDPSAYWNID